MMDIERINENTVKFFITNQDIVNRGFAIDEIWQDKQRGEQLLWEMLDEVQDEIDITFEGTLKIQVNASDSGLEFIISNSPDDLSQKLARFFTVNQSAVEVELEDLEVIDTPDESRVYVFNSFEDVISLFKCEFTAQMEAQVYSYQDRYYVIEFLPEIADIADIQEDDEQVDEGNQFNPWSAYITEFSEVSSVSMHMLTEYGNLIIDNDVHATICKYF